MFFLHCFLTSNHGQKHCCRDSCQQHCCPQRCCHWQLCCTRDHYILLLNLSCWLNLSLIITWTLHGTLRTLLKDSFVPFWGLNGGIDPSENRVLNIRLPDMGLKGRFPLGLKPILELFMGQQLERGYYCSNRCGYWCVLSLP